MKIFLNLLKTAIIVKIWRKMHSKDSINPSDLVEILYLPKSKTELCLQAPYNPIFINYKHCCFAQLQKRITIRMKNFSIISNMIFISSLILYIQDIAHQLCLLAIVCVFWLVISAIANFCQAFSSPARLVFSKSDTVHPELFLNHQTECTPSPLVLCCLQLCKGDEKRQQNILNGHFYTSPSYHFENLKSIPN